MPPDLDLSISLSPTVINEENSPNTGMIEPVKVCIYRVGTLSFNCNSRANFSSSKDTKAIVSTAATTQGACF
jgi:hypothetical protein